MTTNPMTVPSARLLRRSPDRLLAGVASGLAVFLGAPVWLVRLLFVLATAMTGAGLVLYLALWLLVPQQGSDRGVLEGWLKR